MEMTRRSLLGCSAAAAAMAQPGAARPNVLFIITDQQSNCALSANGNPYLRTPAMDALARDGITYSESYCTYPVCSPARSSFFTSRMPHETGVRNNGQAIVAGFPPAKIKTLPVVGELHDEAPVTNRNAQPDLRGLRMPDNIGERFFKAHKNFLPELGI